MAMNPAQRRYIGRMIPVSIAYVAAIFALSEATAPVSITLMAEQGAGHQWGDWISARLQQHHLTDAGPDLIIGTADDTGMQMQAMRRRIQIIDECDPERPSYNCPTPGLSKVRIRTVIVTVSYFVGNLERQETVRTVMTDYAVVEEV